MSALGVPVLINPNRAYWLSSIGNDVIHSTIVTDTIDANLANISTVVAEDIRASTVAVSTLNFQNSDVSGMYVSSIRGNSAFFSSMTIASDLSGGVGFVRFHVDASGVQVDGDPIRFDNLVYLTSTINIIQVSTLVDTDIFASNGFFSTLSSGFLSSKKAYISSLLCDDLSGNYASFDTLFVSTLEALDISGVAASNWSQYPTLNSSIIFQPGFVLSNVGPSLFFSGVEITDVSGGGQDWSRFLAISTVQMNNNLMTGLSTLQFQDGGRLTSLTGNNLQYNGQPIQYGAASNVSQWATYPAVSNVNMNGSNLSNAALIAGSNLTLSGSNITNGNTFTNSLGVGGLSLVPIASITSGGDLSCRNIEVGDSVTGVADVNIYGGGPTVLPGDSALYVQGGVQFDGGAIHGFAAGVLPVAGINTGRMELLTAGFNILHPAVGAITTGAAMSLTAGGAISIAAGGYTELNTSTLQMINTSQGNKNTTIQAGFLTIDPDVAPTSSIKLFNTLGGGVEIDGGGQGSLRGFSTVQAANLSTLNLNVSTIDGFALSSITIPSILDVSAVNVQGNLSVGQSTVTDVLAVTNRATADTILWNLAGGVSTISASYLGQNYAVTNSIYASTNIGQIDAQIIGFSTIQGGQISCINLQTTTINGIPWDASGGNANQSTFAVFDISACTVSSLKAPSGFITVEAPIRFTPLSAIDNVTIINTNAASVPELNIGASTIQFQAQNIFQGSVSSQRHAISDLQASTIKGPPGQSFINFLSPIRFTPLDAIDNVAVINTNGPTVPALNIAASTLFFQAQNVYQDSVSTVKNRVNHLGISTMMPFGAATAIDVSGNLNLRGNINVPLSNAVSFDDGSQVNFSQFEYRDIANNAMLGLTNTPGLASNNMERLGVGELWVTGGADQYAALRIYNQFPYNNFGLDIQDANGSLLFESYATYEAVGGYQTLIYGVSSITGYTEPGGQQATGFANIVTTPTLSTQNLLISSINGLKLSDISGANIPNDKFSTASISSLTVSSINNTDVTFNGSIPIGGIIMWSGAGVPANFALCDGTNGTPNLSAKFIIAEGGNFVRNTTGGSAQISISNLPSHTHTITDPGHAHTVILTGIYNNGESGNETAYAGQALGGPETRFPDINAASTSMTGINITNTTGNNIPYYQPYYCLAYIMRIT